MLSFFGSWTLFAFRRYRHASHLAALPRLAVIILAIRCTAPKPYGVTPDESPETRLEVEYYDNGHRRSEGDDSLGMKDGLHVVW